MMKDLTNHSIPRHIATMAAGIALGLLFQTLYYLVDLYFVAGQGGAALSGVSSAGNSVFLGLAIVQVLSVGTVALVAHAAGRKDRPAANLVFNQSLGLGVVFGALVLVVGYTLAPIYMRAEGANQAAADAGTTYLMWFLPAMALQFGLASMGSALRGVGIVKPTMMVQMVTVIINALLAPVLIAGWGTGHPMGVAGAGLASSISVLLGVIILYVYFAREDRFVAIDRSLMAPRVAMWKRMLAIGLPAGGEYTLMFVYFGLIYWVLRGFGPAAQAGFGVGSRVMQALILPALAIAFAAGPVAGQNFGARKPDRVRATFRAAAAMIIAIMAPLTLLVAWRPDLLVRVFSSDPTVLAMGAGYMKYIAWTFVAQGLVFTCSSLFQGLGNTRPALASSAIRLVLFAVPVLYLSSQADFALSTVWILSVSCVVLQAVLSLALLRRELRKKLGPLETAATIAPVVAPPPADVPASPSLSPAPARVVAGQVQEGS